MDRDNFETFFFQTKVFRAASLDFRAIKLVNSTDSTESAATDGAAVHLEKYSSFKLLTCFHLSNKIQNAYK